MLRIFYVSKNPTASARFEPEASMLTTRPPKPSLLLVTLGTFFCFKYLCNGVTPAGVVYKLNVQQLEVTTGNKKTAVIN
jgi:hypothetical protein